MATVTNGSGLLSLLDLANLDEADPLTGLVEDVTTFAPEFYSVPAETRPGTTYKLSRRIGLPPAQFRRANAGVVAGKSVYKQEVRQMYFLDAPINIDEAIYQADDRSVGDVLANESMGVLQSAVILIGNQFYYGQGNNPGGTAVAIGSSNTQDSNGFIGLRQQLAGVVSAGGSTSTTSAYLVWLGPWGCHFDVGREGQFAMKPFIFQQITAPNGGSGNVFAWVSNISSWIGMAVVSFFSVWAVTGISSDGTTHPLTDKLGAQLLSNIPLSRRNGLCWFMNRTAHYSLQQQRSVTLFGQMEQRPNQANIAPLPDELQGYPIIVTDSITTVEDNT
jgi:hypothetical protein